MGVARTSGLELPRSVLGSRPKPQGEEPAKIVVTKQKVMIAGDPYPIAMLPWDPSLGLDADVKPRGRSDFYITPLVHALGGTANAKQCPAKSRLAGLDDQAAPCSVVIVADAATPYRIVAELAFSARARRFMAIAMAVRLKVDDAPATIDLATGLIPCERMGDPATGMCRPGPAHDTPSVTSVTITKAGFAIDLDDTPVAAGCSTSIPVAAGRLDHASLAACLNTVKRASGGFTPETVAWLGAEADTPLADVVATIDTMRGETATEALYPSVGLLLPREDSK